MTPSEAALLVVDDNDDNRYTLTRRLKRRRAIPDGAGLCGAGDAAGNSVSR